MIPCRAALLALLSCLLLPASPAGAGETAPDYASLPVGAPTALPWWEHGRLHVDGHTITTRRSEIDARGGTTLVARGVFDRPDLEAYWSIARGGHLARLPMKAKARTPFISADGRWVSWLELKAPRTDDSQRVEHYRGVIYDARAGRIVDTLRARRLVEWEDGVNALWWYGIDNTGRVLFEQGDDGFRIWRPGARLVKLRGTQLKPDDSTDGWPLGVTLERRRDQAGVYGTVGPRGVFHRVGVMVHRGTWSPDGRAFWYYVDGDERDAPPRFLVDNIDAGTTVELAVPAPFAWGYRMVGWESATSVILWEHIDYTPAEKVSRLVRCDVTSGACERVPGGPGRSLQATMRGNPA